MLNKVTHYYAHTKLSAPVNTSIANVLRTYEEIRSKLLQKCLHNWVNRDADEIKSTLVLFHIRSTCNII